MLCVTQAHSTMQICTQTSEVNSSTILHLLHVNKSIKINFCSYGEGEGGEGGGGGDVKSNLE